MEHQQPFKPQRPFKIGTLVTVNSAHPDHMKWFGIVIDRECCLEETRQSIPQTWSEKYNIPYKYVNFVFAEIGMWYYVILNEGFFPKTTDKKLLFDCIHGSNLKAVL